VGNEGSMVAGQNNNLNEERVKQIVTEMTTPRMCSPEVLKIAVDEQRRVDDWIAKNYDNVRNKILTLLGGGLASLTFLYSSRQLFIPPEIYGKIFYFAGLSLIILGISTLIHALRPMHWEFTTEDKDLMNIHKVETVTEYLLYVRDKYMAAYKTNLHAYEYKQKLFNFSLYPLIFGVIILVVIKLFSKGGI
jgi:hypothetical protein